MENSFSYDEVLGMGYKKLSTNDTINGEILFKRFNEKSTFLFAFNTKKEFVAEMCLSDRMMEELMGLICVEKEK